MDHKSILQVIERRKRILAEIKEAQEEKGNVMRKSFAMSSFRRIKGSVMYGRGVHDRRTHEQILSLYTESIAFAPTNTEALALGYSHRAELLIHLLRPKNAFIDLVKALEITKSTDLRTKLLAQRAHCLEFLKKSTYPDNFDTQLEIPSFKPSKKVPCAADCVEIVQDRKFGRHIVATRDIEPGEVIIAENSYAAFPNDKNMYLSCSHCLRLAWNAIPCEYCVFAIFCSEACKKEAWNAYHIFECPIIPHVFTKKASKADFAHIMAATRILITAVRTEGMIKVLHVVQSIQKKDSSKNVSSSKEFDCATFRRCYTLTSYEKLITKDASYKEYAQKCTSEVNLVLNLLYKFTDMFNSIRKPVDDVKSACRDVRIYLVLERILFRLRCIVPVNNYEYKLLIQDLMPNVDDSNQMLFPQSTQGLIIAPCSALINHSCYPNVCKIFMPKRKIAMMTMHPVKKGEQLFTDYETAITLDKNTRELYLRNNYYFTCRCQICKNDWISVDLLKLAPSDYKLRSAFQFLQKFYEKNACRLNGNLGDWPITAETIKEAKEVIKLLRKNLKNHDALKYSFVYAIFLQASFLVFYQEKRIMSQESCYSFKTNK